MQLQAYIEEARIDVTEMLERLKAAAAEMGVELDLDISTIYRHARGIRTPGDQLQSIYSKASNGLIGLTDWTDLKNDNSLGMPAKKRRRLERQRAEQEATAA
jgi:hypothetical protein